MTDHDGSPRAPVIGMNGNRTTGEITQWIIKCPNCGDKHYHGPMPGHRVAHCTARGLAPGYVVVEPTGDVPVSWYTPAIWGD